MNTLDDVYDEEAAADVTPHFDWYACFTQWTIGIGVALFPRNEHGIEFAIGPLVFTFRWRHGWRKR